MPAISKEAAIHQMCHYLGHLSKKPAGVLEHHKQANAQRTLQLAATLEKCGNLITAVNKVYPEKNATQRLILCNQLVRGLAQKRAQSRAWQKKQSMAGCGASAHPSAGLSNSAAGSVALAPSTSSAKKLNSPL